MDKVTTGRTRTTQHGWAVDDLGREYVPAEVADELLAALSAPLWLVWSNEHAAWWGPNRCYYYRDISAAGRYTLEEATEIAGLRIGSQKTRETGNPGEMIQPSPEWVAMRAEAIREAAQPGDK